MYQFYMDDELLPITPGKLKMKVNGQNKTINLINGEEVNILNPPGLTDISFDAVFPWTRYPFAQYRRRFRDPEYYLNLLEELKMQTHPFRFIVIRESPSGGSFFDTNMPVSLEDYSINEDAKEGMDVPVTINLKQYLHYGTQRVTIKEAVSAASSDVAEVTMERERDASSAPQVSTYTVQPGDSLCNIAKRFLGDGSRYMEIYNLNRDKISNPNRISIGLMLAMPG